MKAQKIKAIKELLNPQHGVDSIFIYKGNDVEPEFYKEISSNDMKGIKYIVTDKEAADVLIDFLTSFE